MKKQLRKIALAVVFSMAATMFAPAGQALAAVKTFTYAEQKSGDKVTALFMDCNEQVDLKFIGISDYKNHKPLKWASSNEKVAIVDSAGVITALSEGTTTIKLIVGDGKSYTSSGVLVTVGKSQEVTIGTAAQEEIKSYTLEVGKSVMLKANGIKDNVGDRYTFEWSSTDTSVAKVDNNGQLTAVAPGLAVVQLKATKAFSGKVMEATPIAVLVNTKATPIPTATPKPTAKPTVAPTAAPSATVTPTKAPDATATPTPAATNGDYTVAVTSDRSITLTFKNKVSYTDKDVEFSQVIEAGNDDILIKLDLESVELDAAGRIMTIKTKDVLTTDRYNVKVGTDEKGTTFPVTIGAPNSMKLIYSCLGQENVAYAYDEEVGLDVPVTLSYKLYYDNVDVTESYLDEGYIYYELVSPQNSEYVMMSGEQLYFYAANRTAAVHAVYTYYTENGTEKEFTADLNIKAKTIGDYKITKVANWTIVDDKATTIDWNNPVKKVVAGTTGYKVVALLADSYGYYYSTDERGVNKAKNIYSAEDPDTLFAMRGYSYAFSPSNDTNFYVDGAGNLFTYEADSKAAAYITLFNSEEWTSGEKKLDAWSFTILAESKLNTVKLAESTVTLLTQALNNEDRFCEANVEIQLIDQYGNEWNGETVLEVTSSSAVLNNYIGDYATVTKNTKDKWVLHINGKAIYDAGVKNSVTFTVSDPETKKKSSTVRVNLKNPASNTTDGILVNGWDVGMKEEVISFGNGSGSEVAAKAELEIYQLSKNGGYKVGLLTPGVRDENGNDVKIILQEAATHKFDSDNCTPGEIYVLVLGPDGKVVEETSGTGLGVQIDNGKVVINVTESLSNITSLPEGKYTVRVTKINKISNSYVSKTTKTTYFTVEDNTKDVAVAGYNNNRRTSKTLSDSSMEEIICDLFVFTLGGTKWTSLTPEMITAVNYTEQSAQGVYRITSIEFAVPSGGDNTITYSKTVKVNQNIYTGVNH